MLFQTTEQARMHIFNQFETITDFGQNRVLAKCVRSNIGRVVTLGTGVLVFNITTLLAYLCQSSMQVVLWRM